MKLSKRLRAAADFVTPGGSLADVGTDHAYLPIWLVEEGRIERAIAMDVVDGPLERARENILSHQLEEKIEVRKSNGLRALQDNEADTVTITGMGGLLICSILDDDVNKTKTIREFVLEPQSDLEKVREYLLQREYKICDENMVWEDGKFYPVLKVSHGKEETPYSRTELLYGRELLKKRHPVLRKYLEKEIETCKKILPGLVEAQGERAKQRVRELREEIELAQQALEMVNAE